MEVSNKQKMKLHAFVTSALILLFHTQCLVASSDDGFLSVLTPSVGGSKQIGSIKSTMLPYTMNETNSELVEIDSDGNLSTKISGLSRMQDGILSYEELFATLVCDGKVVQNSNAFNVTDDKVVEMVQSGFYPAISTCSSPIILIRRNGCRKSQGCSKDDRTNTRWLAKSGDKICPSSGYGNSYLFSTGIKGSPASKHKLKYGKVTGSWSEFTVNEGGKVEIDMDGNFKATFSGLRRASDDITTYSEIFASLVCSHSIVNNTEAVAISLDDIHDEVEIYAEAFVTEEDMRNCVGPTVLFRRHGCTKESGCPKNDPRNTKFVGLSGFTYPTG